MRPLKGAVKTLQAAVVVAADGKTAKGSKTGTQRPANVVRAFSSAANLAIGQIACEEKSPDAHDIFCPLRLTWRNAGTSLVCPSFFVRSRNNRKDWLVPVSTDVSLSGNKILQLCGK